METLRIHLVGAPRIACSSGEERAVRGHKPWAVLARLVLAERPVGRRGLSSELFPDADDPLGSLRWCLAGLRKALGDATLFTGDPIDVRLPPSISVDVHGIGPGDLDDLLDGELIEGIDPAGGPELATWLLVARRQVAARVDAVLRDEVIASLSHGRTARALSLAERAARRSPYDEGVHVLLARCLVQAGDHGGAARHVEEVERRFRADLGCDPSPALQSAARPQVAAPPPGVTPGAIASSLLDAGRAAVGSGAVDAGIDCLRRAAAQAESVGDRRLEGSCLYELGNALVHSVRGFDDEGSILLDRAAVLAGETGDQETAVAALRERAYVDALAGRRPEAEHLLEAAAGAAGDDPALVAGVSAVRGFNLTDWGRLDDGMDQFERAVEASRRSGSSRREAWALGIGGWSLLRAGRLDEAQRWESECLTLVEDLGWVLFSPWPRTVLAEARLTGESPPNGVAAELEHCFALSVELADPCWEGASGRVMGLSLVEAGDLDAGLAWLAEARVRSMRRSDLWARLVGEIMLSEAEVRLALGDARGADAVARDLIALAARTQLDAILDTALEIVAAAR
jgi:DNA-binding SARP family transcriptional activator